MKKAPELLLDYLDKYKSMVNRITDELNTVCQEMNEKNEAFNFSSKLISLSYAKWEVNILLNETELVTINFNLKELDNSDESLENIKELLQGFIFTKLKEVLPLY